MGGVLLALHWPLRDIFFIFAVPLLIACLCILALSAVVKSGAAARAAAAPAIVQPPVVRRVAAERM
jgi:hypothetical protein